MRIAFGCDHGGFEIKNELINFVKGLKHEVLDLGTNTPDSCNYPIFAEKVAVEVASKKSNRGILLCRSGIGMAIAANKVAGVRAFSCREEKEAQLARAHNDTNVICLGADFTSLKNMKKIIQVWLSTEHEGGRHQKRVEMIGEIEKRHLAC